MHASVSLSLSAIDVLFKHGQLSTLLAFLGESSTKQVSCVKPQCAQNTLLTHCGGGRGVILSAELTFRHPNCHHTYPKTNGLRFSFSLGFNHKISNLITRRLAVG